MHVQAMIGIHTRIFPKCQIEAFDVPMLVHRIFREQNASHAEQHMCIYTADSSGCGIPHTKATFARQW